MKTMQELIDSITRKEYHVDIDGYGFDVYKTVSLSDALTIIYSIVESCFGEDQSYKPEAMDIASKRMLLEYYTNIDIPKDLSDVYTLIYNTDIIPIIMSNINRRQWENIMDSANKLVSYRCDIQRETIKNKLDEVTAHIQAMMDQVNGLFDGVTNDDISAMTNAITNGSFDMDKFATSLVNLSKNDKS